MLCGDSVDRGATARARPPADRASRCPRPGIHQREARTGTIARLINGRTRLDNTTHPTDDAMQRSARPGAELVRDSLEASTPTGLRRTCRRAIRPAGSTPRATGLALRHNTSHRRPGRTSASR
jgi:hypothetical protein